MNPTAYPLQWPTAWPREQFRQDHPRMRTTVPASLNLLNKELAKMGAKSVVLSSNYTLGDQSPKDTGVCAYFSFRGKSYAIPCDRWRKIEHNIQAIALTIKAMRGMERWGAKNMIEAMFIGFKALPDSKRKWWEVLGIPASATEQEGVAAYRRLAFQRHPDQGGSNEAMVELNEAWATFKKEMGMN